MKVDINGSLGKYLNLAIRWLILPLFTLGVIYASYRNLPDKVEQLDKRVTTIETKFDFIAESIKDVKEDLRWLKNNK